LPKRCLRHCIVWFIAPLAVACTVASTSASDVARWPDEHVAGSLVCHADFQLDHCQRLINEVAQLQEDLNQTLGIHSARIPIHLFLFEKQSTYKDYIKRWFPNIPYRRALFVKGDGPGMVFAYLSPEFAVDVRHESTHALLHSALPLVPLWLDEGLAEYFEIPPGERAYDNPHLGKLRWNIRLGSVPDIEKLEELRGMGSMKQSDYRYCWAWVHFLLHGPPEAQDELRRYLADIKAHTPPGRLSERLAKRLGNLDQRFLKHFRSWKRKP